MENSDLKGLGDNCDTPKRVRFTDSNTGIAQCNPNTVQTPYSDQVLPGCNRDLTEHPHRRPNRGYNDENTGSVYTGYGGSKSDSTDMGPNLELRNHPRTLSYPLTSLRGGMVGIEPSTNSRADSGHMRRAYRKPIMQPDKFEGGPNKWREYISHFETCSILNEWGNDDQLLWLKVSLRGRAASVLIGVPNHSWTYASLKTALERRFGPNQQPNVYLAQLRSRKRKPNESVWDLCEVIRDLVSLAYPDVSGEALNRLALDAFIDSLTSWEMIQFILARQPIGLEQAVDIASEWECYKNLNWNERRRGVRFDDSFTGRTLFDDNSSLASDSSHGSSRSLNSSKLKINPDNNGGHSDIEELKSRIDRLNADLVRERAKNNKNKCTYCGKWFHTEDKCYSKHGRPGGPSPQPGN